MKKLLNELRKLNKDDSAPAGFKERVIERIQQEPINSTKQKSNIVPLKKYVIPTFTAVAVVMIACVVSIKNQKSKEVLMEDSPELESKEKMQFAIESKMIPEAYDFAAKNDDLRAINSAASMATMESAMEDSIEEEQCSSRKNEILEILKQNDIEMVEENDSFVIVKSTAQEIKNILSEIQEEFTIEELENGDIKLIISPYHN